jgi:uncharacterized protein
MSDSIVEDAVYFANRGKENTDEIARIVTERLAEGDVTAVVVATTSGYSALTIGRAVPEGTRVYGVNFQNGDKLDKEIRQEAEKSGVKFMPDKPVARYIRDVEGHSPDSLRCLGQGMKVSVEVIMQAVEVGHVKPGERVIGVGGSSRGADVAIVAVAQGPDNLSGLWVSEILAKPH